MKRLLLLSIALLLPSLAAFGAPAPVSGAAAHAAAAVPLTLRVVDRDRDGWIILEARYARSEGRAELDLLLNGSAVAIWKTVGSGSGSGIEERTLAVSPVFPGEKKITVRLGNQNAEIVVDYRPRAAIKPRWIDRELVGAEHVLLIEERFTDSLVVRVNGAPVEIGYQRGIAEDLVTRTAVAFAESLRPGPNEIVITAVGPQGEALAETSTLISAPGGRLAEGTVFRILFGCEKSRSGPFYQATIEGEAVRLIKEEGFPDGRLIGRFRIAGTGLSKIVIRVKPHFRDSWKIDREIPIEGIAE